MAHLYHDNSVETNYWDKKSGLSRKEWMEALANSKTLYVGNLSFYTTEDQLLEIFNKCGEVKRVVMGLNRHKKSPCGFCFVEFYSHDQAEVGRNLLSGAIFDDRNIRVDWDAGITDGRQFGRGETGDQWRDDFRDDFDQCRGGHGRGLLKKLQGDEGQQVYIGKRKFGEGGKGKGKG